eukprot:GHVL01007791.1.p1 GENE.GHVL01007791.1~~GHVL01007791.1.p1  ORF type:complete len:112 (+),score=4.51 GHVL01007791.1:322-657(+)
MACACRLKMKKRSRIVLYTRPGFESAPKNTTYMYTFSNRGENTFYLGCNRHSIVTDNSPHLRDTHRTSCSEKPQRCYSPKRAAMNNNYETRVRETMGETEIGVNFSHKRRV